MTASRAFAVGVALLCATCCPSLFLTITRSRPAPRQPLPAAQAPKEPLPRPPEIANRFDVLLRGAPLPAGHDPAYDAYDDEAAPDHHGASTDGLMAIARDFGAPGIPVIAAPAPRINGCVGCPGGHCNEVLVDVPSASIQPGRDARPSAALFAGPLSYLTVVENIEDSIAEDAAVVFPGCTVHDGQTVIHFSGAVADLRPAQIVEVMVSPWSVAQTLTSFVQISDVQIRDADIRLGDRVLSNRLDKLIESMEYDQDLEFYNRYVVEALFATINGVARYYRDAAPHSPEKPDFVIHTGDAIDSGMMSELREVHHLFDQLELPTFDALGNHDVLVFGNIMPTADHTDHACGTAISAARPKAHLLDDHPGLLPDKLCVNAQVDCPDCLPGEAKLVAGLSHLEAHRNFMAELARHVDYAVPVFDHPGGGAYCKGPDGNDAFEGAPAISPAAIGHGFDLNTYVDPRDGNRYPRATTRSFGRSSSSTGCPTRRATRSTSCSTRTTSTSTRPAASGASGVTR